MNRAARWLLPVALLLAVPPGCGGSSSDGGGGAYTLETLCDTLPETICRQRESCCEATHGFDEASCVARERAACEGNVAKAEVGDYTFDASSVDACLAAIGSYLAACRPALSARLAALPGLRACAFVFYGTRQEGESCAEDEDCAPAVGDNATATCDDDTGRCRIFRVLREGDACELSSDLGGVCESGLYCDLAQGAATGTCKRAVSIGGACSGPASLQCGLGQYCEAETCVAGKPAGGDCSQLAGGLACASLECAAGQCAEVEPVVDPEDCQGP